MTTHTIKTNDQMISALMLLEMHLDNPSLRGIEYVASAHELIQSAWQMIAHGNESTPVSDDTRSLLAAISTASAIEAMKADPLQPS